MTQAAWCLWFLFIRRYERLFAVLNAFTRSVDGARKKTA